ncbi:MAG: hypothetical protein HWE34_16315 [Methylocystaceae bacterium]|nr:hypothetical protein [Methylocystaceae bacterium]
MTSLSRHTTCHPRESGAQSSPTLLSFGEDGDDRMKTVTLAKARVYFDQWILACASMTSWG